MLPGGDIDFSWDSIWKAATEFIQKGQEGANYIDTGSMSGLAGRVRKHINYHRRCYCPSWNSSNWYTIHDGNTRRGGKIKNKASWTSSGRNCYTRCLGNLESNINFLKWNEFIKYKGGFEWVHIIYHVM